MTAQTTQAFWHEALQADGEDRASWRHVSEFLNRTSYSGLQHLEGLLRTRISEQEMTYNIYGAPGGSTRPWPLDLVPMVVAGDEWQVIEHGINQRAHLLECFLADCYGTQRCLQEGILPHSLIFGNPGFLRACHGWQPYGSTRLHCYAADLVRSPNGQWKVLKDRCQEPTGAGYALENRLVIARCIPEVFERSSVRRLSNWFDTPKNTIDTLSRDGAGRTALLSSGPNDESSFEHAYLARYLGYDLVEGRDLEVRGNGVFLKTLGGLKPIDVLLRRVADAYADPLFLNDSGALGPAGLVRAAANGEVAVANSLSSGVLEHPAIRAYLPALCKFYLNQELQLPSIDTYWCGDPQHWQQVEANFSRYVFHRNSSQRPEPIFADDLSSEKQQQLCRKILAQPQSWTASRYVPLSKAPVWRQGLMAERGVGLRCFAVHSDAGYVTMPGGLTRVNAEEDRRLLSLRHGGGSKDTWIIADEPEDQGLPSMPTRPIQLRRGGLDVPSLLLDDLYWLGRYAERCECVARCTRAALEYHQNQSTRDGKTTRNSCYTVLQNIGAVGEQTKKNIDENDIIAAIITGEDSIHSLLQRIRSLGSQVRSRLSRDAWRTLHELTGLLSGPVFDSQGRAGSAISLLDKVISTSSAFTATILENMVRGHAWTFLDLGRRIERLGNTFVILDSCIQPQGGRGELLAALDLTDSLLTYRARYLSRLQPAPVVDLVLTDDSNPRSCAFQCAAITDHLAAIPSSEQHVGLRPPERLAVTISSRLATIDINHLCAGDGNALQQLVQTSLEETWALSNEIAAYWFTHASQETSRSNEPWRIVEAEQ